MQVVAAPMGPQNGTLSRLNLNAAEFLVMTTDRRQTVRRLSWTNLSRIQEEDENALAQITRRHEKRTSLMTRRSSRQVSRRLSSTNISAFDIHVRRWEEQIERKLTQLMENLKILQETLESAGSRKDELVGTYKAWEAYGRSIEMLLLNTKKQPAGHQVNIS